MREPTVDEVCEEFQRSLKEILEKTIRGGPPLDFTEDTIERLSRVVEDQVLAHFDAPAFVVVPVPQTTEERAERRMRYEFVMTRRRTECSPDED